MIERKGVRQASIVDQSVVQTTLEISSNEFLSQFLMIKFYTRTSYKDALKQPQKEIFLLNIFNPLLSNCV